jgi:hypothetical protein
MVRPAKHRKSGTIGISDISRRIATAITDSLARNLAQSLACPLGRTIDSYVRIPTTQRKCWKGHRLPTGDGPPRCVLRMSVVWLPGRGLRGAELAGCLLSAAMHRPQTGRDTIGIGSGFTY